MTNYSEKALRLFEQKYNCSQSVFATIGAKLGIDEKDAIAIAAGFGAGMCYQGNTCGAVTGAYMTLGLISSKNFSKAEDIKENSYQLITDFNKKFTEKHNSIICNQLLGVDMSTEQGVQQAVENKLFENKCPEFVKSAVEILTKYL